MEFEKLFKLEVSNTSHISEFSQYTKASLSFSMKLELKKNDLYQNLINWRAR